jgi:Sec-independent protein secretion pathway component TatC
MNVDKKSAVPEDRGVGLSTLWIFVLFNMVFADIVGFMNPGALEGIITGAVGIEITQELLLVFSVLLEIPIAMIFLSRILKYRINRWANIVACVITILFVIGGGSAYLSYIFFATVEVICMLFMIWYAWTWRQPAAQPIAALEYRKL